MTRPLVALAVARVVVGSACASRATVDATCPVADIQILGFDDFHGALEPPTGANGRIGTVAAGGVASALTSLIEHYEPFFVKIGQRRIGTLTAPLLEANNEAGGSALGDVIADTILEQTSAGVRWRAGGAVEQRRHSRRSNRAACCAG